MSSPSLAEPEAGVTAGETVHVLVAAPEVEPERLAALLPDHWSCVSAAPPGDATEAPDLLVVSGNRHTSGPLRQRWPLVPALVVLPAHAGAEEVRMALSVGIVGCVRDPAPVLVAAHLLALRRRGLRAHAGTRGPAHLPRLDVHQLA